MTSVQKLAGLVVLILVLIAGSAGITWQVQEWRLGQMLAKQAGLHQADLSRISLVTAAQARTEQDKRLALEQKLDGQDQQYFKELSDAQRNQALLRDRLATADVRLSVLLETTDSISNCNVPTTSGTVGVVHAARRARLNPAHAQRIIRITNAGDQGLIALRACQTYIRELSK